MISAENSLSPYRTCIPGLLPGLLFTGGIKYLNLFFPSKWLPKSETPTRPTPLDDETRVGFCYLCNHGKLSLFSESKYKQTSFQEKRVPINIVNVIILQTVTMGCGYFPPTNR